VLCPLQFTMLHRMKGHSKKSNKMANLPWSWSEIQCWGIKIVSACFKLHPRWNKVLPRSKAYKLSIVGLTIFVVAISLNLSYCFSGKEVRRHSEFPPGNWY